MVEKHYRGGCQCGAVAYEVDIDIDNAIICNCSRCKPMGFVLAFTPRDKFRLKQGGGSLTEYLFNKNRVQHRFCSICGVESFALGVTSGGGEIAAINVNCLEDVDTWTLTPAKIDGRTM